MWKESLRIGVDLIDEQHKELFRITGDLLKELRGSSAERKEKCASTVLFLKNYTVRHFAEEEAYQKSVGYPGFGEHVKLHDKFRETVSLYDQKMIASDYADKDIKEFTGMLIAWLLYHISDADQKFGKIPFEAPQEHGAIISNSVCDTLRKMAGFDDRLMNPAKTDGETADGAFVVEIGLTGDISGYIVFVYPPGFIKNLIQAVMGYIPDVIDELEISVLFEASNIISGNICGQIAREKHILCDITTPFSTQRPTVRPDERIALDTGKGIVEVDMSVSYK